MMTPKDALKTPKTCSTETGPGRLAQLSLMRVIACVGIVVLHTVFAADEYFAQTVSAADHMVSRMVENNMMWAVPSFVMVTGVLQLEPGKTLTLKKLYGRYILRILIALIACCLLFRIFDMIMDGEAFTIGGVLYAFAELVTGRCWGHLWYLYLLIGLYVLLPFYRMAAEKASDRELLYLCGAFLLFVSIIPLIEGFGLPVGFYISESIIYPLYLFLGYMIMKDRIAIGARTGLLLLLLSTAAILIMDYMKYGLSMDLPGELFGYASPAVIAQAIGAFTVICKGRPASIRNSRLLQAADECSFGIYLIHMIFIRSLFRYLQWDPYQGVPVLTLGASVLGILVISFGIVLILRKIPGVSRVL